MSRRGGERRDIKSRTRVNYTVFDEDVGSRYDYDDDDSSMPVRQGVSRAGNSGGGFASRAQVRRDNQMLRVQATGTNMKREMVFLISVRNCARSGVDNVLAQIAESVERFRPIAPKLNQGHVEFYLANGDDAEAVKSMSRRISDRKSGQKFVITSSRVPAPWEALRPAIKILIETVIKNRYSAASNSLDLGDFVNDKEFVNANLHCPLFKNEIVVCVSNVLARLYPSLQGLSLKGNRLRGLDYIATLAYAVPNVVELDLSSNALSRIEELDRIRNWKIERLHLENNECVSKFGADASAYASVVQDYFPRLSYLDGVFVTQNPLKIRVQENDGLILPYKLGYHPDAAVREHVERFIVEYLGFYDGPNGEQTRKSLMNAYDDNATLTFAIHRLKDAVTRNFNILPKGDEESFSTYIRSSHNIIYESKWGNYRDKIVYKGAMDIAVALSKLPLTTHLMESFILDFNFISSEIVVFTLQGLLRDGRDAFKDDGDCKLFLRNFVVVPKGENRMAIISDMLTLTPIATARMERYVELMKRGATNELREQQSISSLSALALSQPQQPLPSGSMSCMDSIAKTSELFNMLGGGSAAAVAGGLPAPPPTPQPPAAAAPPGYDVNDPTVRQAMIQQFSDISKMKPEWAEKCLSDCQWDFEAAGNAFNLMFNQKQIPKDAFR